MTSIGIEVTTGNAGVTEEDRERAAAAAEAVITEAGATVSAAFAEYQAQWEALDNEAGMTGLAALWVKAASAANVALTQGWAKPGRALCSIYA